VAKVLTRFKDTKGVSSSARHAANQLLLRLKYLVFDDVSAITDHRGRGIISDYAFDGRFVESCQHVKLVQKVSSGAKPRADILKRPICCGKTKSYPSALYAAVHDFSFGSTHIRHVDNVIDDVLIANNIASSADDGTIAYGHSWGWAVSSPPPASSPSLSSSSSPNSDSTTSLSILALAALNISHFCGCDTTATSL